MLSLNQAAFIEAAVRSVLGQDWLSVELIVADGGSTDGTLEILRGLAQTDSRLRVACEPDNGFAAALNKALSKVRGTVVGWLNADDLYTSGAFTRAMQAFAAHPDWLLVYGNGEYVDAAGRTLEPYATRPPSTPIEAFAQGCFICRPTVFFRRTLPVLLGKLDEELDCAFDLDYWLRVFKALPARIGFIEALQAQSRLDGQCATAQSKGAVMLERMRVLHRHLGQAPANWVLTYVEELVADKIKIADNLSRRQAVLDLLATAGEYLPPGAEAILRGQIIQDSRLSEPVHSASQEAELTPPWPQQSNCLAPA